MDARRAADDREGAPPARLALVVGAKAGAGLPSAGFASTTFASMGLGSGGFTSAGFVSAFFRVGCWVRITSAGVAASGAGWATGMMRTGTLRGAV